MKFILTTTVSLLLVTGSVHAQSVATGRGDDNYGSNVAAGNNASSAISDQSANAAGKTTSKAQKDRRAANKPSPGKSAAETAGAATPDDSSRPEAAQRSGR
jgi:hypothetical protein